MARKIFQSFLEIYIRSYLRQNKLNGFTISNINLLKKARTYIEQKLENNCCSDLNPIINLYTNSNNTFTDTVYSILKQLPVNNNRVSLQRSINLINNFINGCCIQSGPFGIIYSNNSWDSTEDFTFSGTSTLVSSNSKLIIGGGTGNYNDTVGLTNFATGIEKYKITLLYKVSTLDSTSFGLGIGLKSINNFGAGSKDSIVARIASHTDPTFQGRLLIDVGNNSPYLNVADSNTSRVPLLLNDIIELTLDFSVNKATAISRNITQNSTPISVEYTYGVNTPYLPNLSLYSIYSFGGNYEIQSFKIESTEFKNADLMIVGDSKTRLYNASAFENRYASLLKTTYPDLIVNAGGYDRTQEVLQKIPQIINFSPKVVVLNIGSNNKRTGDSFATWSSQYDTIVNSLQAAGIKVYHLLMLNETVIDFTDYNNYILSTYSSTQIINAGLISLDADGVHPNDLGHAQIANAIQLKLGNI